MKLSRKLTIWSSMTLLFMLIFGSITWYYVRTIVDVSMKVNHTFRIMQESLVLQNLLTRLEDTQESILLVKDQMLFKNYYELQKKIEGQIEKMSVEFWTKPQIELLGKIKSKIKDWESSQEKELTAENIKSINYEEAVRNLREESFSLKDIKEEIEQFSMKEHLLMKKREKDAYETFTLGMFILIISFSGLIILYSLYSYFTAKSITGPIYKISRMLKDVAEGNADLTQRLKVNRIYPEEISDIMKYFNQFIEKLQTTMNNIKKHTGIIDNTITGLSKTAAEFANRTVMVVSSSDQLSRISGDVTGYLNGIQDKNARIIDDANNNILEYHNKLEETVRNEVDFLKNTEEKTKDIYDTVIKLNEQILSIEKMINSLKDISSQSTILSVNASIQASRAGEYGNCFEIIAMEIKELAIKSKNTLSFSLKSLKEVQNNANRTLFFLEKYKESFTRILRETDIMKSQLLEKQSERLNDTIENIKDLSENYANVLTTMSSFSDETNTLKSAAEVTVKGAKKLEEAGINLENLSKLLKELTENLKT